MDVESLASLKTAFEEWRSRKRHSREAVPAILLERARQAARRHGPGAVARATKLDRRRLHNGDSGRRERSAARAPRFSRVEIAAPAVAVRPFAEVETATGVKVRLFTPTGEALALLSSLCGGSATR